MIISSISQTKTNTTSHAKCITNAHCHCTIGWRSLSVTRQNGSADHLAVPHHRRAPQPIRLPSFLLSPGGPLYIARCYTISDATSFRYLNSVPSIHLFNSQTSKNQNTHSYTPNYNITTHMHLSSVSTHSSLL